MANYSGGLQLRLIIAGIIALASLIAYLIRPDPIFAVSATGAITYVLGTADGVNTVTKKPPKDPPDV